MVPPNRANSSVFWGIGTFFTDYYTPVIFRRPCLKFNFDFIFVRALISSRKPRCSNKMIGTMAIGRWDVAGRNWCNPNSESDLDFRI